MNAVAPGAIATPMNLAWIDDEKKAAEARQKTAPQPCPRHITQHEKVELLSTRLRSVISNPSPLQ